MDKIFLGRQPIYDKALRVHAYELLYRPGPGLTAGEIDGDRATSSVIINTLTELGLDTVLGDRKGFINLTLKFLLGDHPIPFPPERVALEILEDIEVNDELVNAVRELKQKGFEVALDDYNGAANYDPLLEVIDLIKVDLMAVDRLALPELVTRLKQHDLKLLAEKVETQDDFDLCVQLGFDLFQGYFLCKPKVLHAQRIPGNRLAIMQLLSKLQNPEAPLDELVALISQNVTLSYKILRYVNSAHFGLSRQIESVRQAVVLLGQNTIRNLAALMTLSEVYDKPDELIRLSMIRARMCEQLAEADGIDTGMAFTVGLFSTLDALLDAPMETIMESLPLAEDVKNALVHRTGPAGQLLETVICYERGHWEQPECLHFQARTLTEAYFNALNWADTLFAEIASAGT
jgi:EAL and modified HD-GYP domain-containing signal transduction protein